MDLNLQDRKVLITGVGEGIGRTLALDFARKGAHVAGAARTASRLHALEEEIEGHGHFFCAADLSKAEAVRSFHDKTMEAFGGLDILVNNVGAILNLGNFFEISDEDWQSSFDINLMSAVRLCRHFVPTLKNSGAPVIINISSIAVTRPSEAYPHYSAMKAALSNLTLSLAKTLAPDKIRVNSVSPGPVWTPSWENEAKKIAENSKKDPQQVGEKIRAQTSSRVLLNRMGVPEDVAGLVLFLASDQASWITGQDFVVDGGHP